MSNPLRKLLKRAKQLLGKRQPLPGRTFVRNQGCYNCVGFETGPLYTQAKVSTGMRDVRVYLEQGLQVHEAAIRVGLRDRKLDEYGAGICLRGGAQADFVKPKYLCDKWVGRVAVDRFQGGVDDLPGELKDKLGDPSVVVDGKHVVPEPAPEASSEAPSNLIIIGKKPQGEPS